MATTKEFANSFLAKLDIPDLRLRPMMGEYVLYYKEKVVGGIYDELMLLKPAEGLYDLVPEAELRIPYAGAKPMVYIKNFDRELLIKVFELLFVKLPEPKKRKTK